MKLTSPSTITSILTQHNIILKPHSKGQNFLVDYNVLQNIISTANIKKTDLIVEIGPGLGTMTRELAHQAKAVFAVELDKELYKIITQETLLEYPNVTVVNKDALSHKCYQDLTKWLIDNNDTAKKFPPYKLVANIPYNITSKIIRQFLETTPQPTDIVIMIQKEVAERIMATPGKMNLLALSVQYYSKPQIVMQVSRNSFLPKPKIDSTVIAIRNINQSNDTLFTKKFFQIAKIGFASKRKQLQNNLSTALSYKSDLVKKILKNVGLPEQVRAQELSITEWKQLTKKFLKLEEKSKS